MRIGLGKDSFSISWNKKPDLWSAQSLDTGF